MQVLAEHLLDANFSRVQEDSVGNSGATSDELDANVQHNLSDAIAILPKLTTGIDVNVRFDHIRSLEYTSHTAVFDILGIDLVHGWLLDTQDASTAAAIGKKSYNEVVLNLVSVLGEDAAQAQVNTLSPTHSGRPTPVPASTALPPDRRQVHLPPPSAATPAPQSGTDAPSSDVGTSSSPRKAAEISQLSDTVESALRIQIPEGPSAASDIRSLSTSDSAVSQDSVISAINALMGDTVKDAFKTPIQTPAGDSAVHHQSLPPQGEPGMGQPSQPPRSQTIKPLELSQTRDEGAVHDALLAQQFLDSNPSQLTIYGLASLHDGLHNNQLAVLFRNNHFNVLLKREGGLYILVTDQGYLYEPDIVWEHLSNVDGDTQLLNWELRPFTAHALNTPSTTAVTTDDIGNRADIVDSHVNRDSDADFALAMQLQHEEEERARGAEERRQTAAAEQYGRSQQQPATSGSAPHESQGQAGGRSGKKKKDKTARDCCVM